MSYVVDSAIARIRETFGHYTAAEWERFLTDCGLDVWFDDLPDSTPAFIHDDCVYIQRGLSADATARRAWHEAGHFCLHAGTREWWRSRPQGHITLAKFERQADTFAALFPSGGG